VDHVLEDFERGWNDGSTEFNGLGVEEIEGIVKSVSTSHPKLRIYVRGMGEEYGDMWLRQFENGVTVHAIGPFEDCG
jgi:hypothetical protein